VAAGLGLDALVWIGTVTMAVGVMYAMVQTDLKRMLAFSTVSQIGYMMMGIGIGTPLAITAGLLHCLNHGFFKGGLFLTAGSVQHASGTRDMNQLGGLAQKMPHTTLSWLIGVGSMMGIPLMSGFASKWMLYAAALQAGWAVPAMVAWAVSLGTVFLCAKATSAVFLGPLTEATKDAHESPPTMVWGMGFMAAGSVVLGVAPQLAVNYFLNPILGALGLGTGVQVTWFGLFADAGSFSTTGGLVLAVVSLVLGGADLRHCLRRAPARLRLAAARAGRRGRRNLYRRRAFVRPGKAHGRRLLRASSCRTGMSSSAGRMWTASIWASGADCRRFRAGWASWSRGWSGTRRCWLWCWRRQCWPACAGWPRSGACRRLPAPRCRAAGCRLRRGRGRVDSGRAYETPQSPPVAADDSRRRGYGCGPGRCRSMAAAWASGTGRAADVRWSGKAREHAAAKLTYLAVVVISALSLVAATADGARTAGLGARAAADQRLRQAGRRAALLLAAQSGRRAAGPGAGPDYRGRRYGRLRRVLYICAGFSEPLHAAGLLLGAAAATSFLAALLMLTQRSLKRLLVLSTVEDVGFLLLGLASASAAGNQGRV
jgi:hypothetical protein